MAKGLNKEKKQAKKGSKVPARERDRQKARKKVSANTPVKTPFQMAGGLLGLLPSWSPLVLFMLVGLFLRLSVTLWEPMLYPDTIQYMHLASEIKSGEFFKKDFDLDQGFIKSRRLPPLYPLLIAPFADTKADLEYVGTSISIFMSVLVFIPLYIFTYLVFNRRTAFFACALVCFHAYTLLFSTPVLTEATFTALFLSVIALSTYSFIRPSIWIFAACGALCSLLYMTRDVGITAVLVTGAGALVKLGIIDRIGRRRLIGLLVALAVSFLLVSAPYFAHIRLRTGHWGLTVQMSNTSITRQIQLAGGTRFDRDIVDEYKKGTRLLGDEPAGGVLDLVMISPALVVKTFRNMGLYGIELLQRWGIFIVPLIVIGIGAIFRNFVRDRDPKRLFMEGWIVVWVFQLFFLYSFITPFMVDDRYMSPLMIPGIILAGHGIATISQWLKDRLVADQEAGSGNMDYLQACVFIAALIFYLAVIPSVMEPDAVTNYGFTHQPGMIYIFPLAGLVVLFGLAMVPGVRLVFSSPLPKQVDPGETVTVWGLLLAGIIALMVPDLGPPLIKYLPGLVLTGAGLALATRLISIRPLVMAPNFSLALSVFLIGATFLAQWPDFTELQTRMSRGNLFTKFSSGYKQAAQEIKDLRLIPPGKMICSRKAFIAYYLDGKWYRNQETLKSIPQKIEGVIEHIQAGEFDYLAGDSFTFKHRRVFLTELVYGLEPLPGARIIYTKAFPELHRIITIYDCRQSEPPLPNRPSAEAHLAAANDFYQAGRIPFAYREAKRAVELDPKNLQARTMVIEILRVYYSLSVRSKIPVGITAPNVLRLLRQSADEYVRLNPDDSYSQALTMEMNRIFKREEDVVKNFNVKWQLE